MEINLDGSFGDANSTDNMDMKNNEQIVKIDKHHDPESNKTIIQTNFPEIISDITKVKTVENYDIFSR